MFLDDVNRFVRFLAEPLSVTRMLWAWTGWDIAADVKARDEMKTNSQYGPLPADVGDMIQMRIVCLTGLPSWSTVPKVLVKARAFVNMSRLSIETRSKLRTTSEPLGTALLAEGMVRKTIRYQINDNDTQEILDVEANLFVPAAGGGLTQVAHVEETFLRDLFDLNASR